MKLFEDWRKDSKIYDVCKVCHDKNNELMVANGETPRGDWESLDQVDKDLTYKSVKRIIDDRTITAKDIHDEWMTNKESDGWVYGLVKDPVNKTHPLMIPFDEMSDIDKQKDQSFIDIVNTYF